MDDLDDLLTPPPPADPARRATVYRSTAGVLRHRRWVRRATRGLLLGLMFAAGVAIAWPYRSQPEPKAEPLVADATPPAAPADPYRNDPPEKLERWAAVVAPEKRSTLYRRAGDGFLDRGDQLGALRCYRHALAGSTEADLAIQPGDDTWLMMSLKVARRKEKIDARP